MTPPNVSSRARALIYGFTLFGIQVFNSVQAQLSALTPKTVDLAEEAILGPAGVTGVGLLLYYLLFAFIANVAPLMLVAEVHRILSLRGHARVRTILNIRGAADAAMVAAVSLLAWANLKLFPASNALPHLDLVFAQPACQAILIMAGAVGIASLFYALLLISHPKKLIVAGSVLLLAMPFPTTPGPNEPRTRPDIILIGVDSLRADHLRIYGFPNAGFTPVIDEALAASVVFTEAFTPQARTFVAYMSILTGQYPIRNGVRENLYPRREFDRSSSVAHLFRRHGYFTALAIDESRFANFDEHYGFDEVAAPPAGTLDFVVGSFFDTIGTNLAQVAPASDVLIPHLKANRAAHRVYRPQAHSTRLDRLVINAPRERPLFLVAHFCIAHSPYAPMNGAEAPPLGGEFHDSPRRYRAALKIADDQVSSLLGQLRAAGRLENAFVVIFSDHGEALGLDKDAWTVRERGTESQRKHYGHGAPALDEAQIRVVLAMQRYVGGRPVLPPQRVAEPVSLVDLAPTTLSAASLSYDPKQFDGIPLLKGTLFRPPPPRRPVFVESGITGVSLQKKEIAATEVANEFSSLYAVTPDGRFELKQDTLPRQFALKQRGVILGRFGVSTWRPAAPGSTPCWLKLDRKRMRAECLPLDTDDYVARTYARLICRHYAKDEEFIRPWCP